MGALPFEAAKTAEVLLVVQRGRLPMVVFLVTIF
jgi:hypothetical protein